IHRRRARSLSLANVENRVFHSQRFEDSLAQELIEILARGDFDNSAESVEACAWAVGPAAARLKLERHLAATWDVVCECIARFSLELGCFSSTDRAAH